MNQELLDKKLETIDLEFQRTDVPIFRRALLAFPKVAPNYHGPLGGYGVHRSNFGAFEGPNRGVKMGRKPSISQADRERAVEMVAKGMPKATVAKELGFSRQKLYDILNEQS